MGRGVCGVVVVPVVVLGLAAACGDDASPVDGGTTDAAGRDGSVAVAAPALPVLEPCAFGWNAVTRESGLVDCEPWPALAPAECGPAEAHFPGSEGCRPVGAACPPGDFPDPLPPGDRHVFVRAGATGGDGSRARPFGSLAEADVGRLAAGTAVMIARGTYDDEVRVLGGVSLHGTCASETILTSSAASETAAVINVLGGPVTIDNLSVRGAERMGIWAVGEGAQVRIAGVAIEDNRFMGLLANGGTVFAEDLIVRGTRSRASDRGVGRGISLEAGSTAELYRVAVEANREYGIRVGDDGSSLVADAIAVRGTLGQERDGAFGRGISVEYGASAEISNALVEANLDVGVLVLESTATLRDALVRRTDSEPRDGSGGRGIAVQAGSIATLERVVVDANREIGVFATDIGTELGATDLVVRGTQFDASDDTGGMGLHVQDGARATIVRALLERNQTAGVVVTSASMPGASATFEDLSVLGTISARDGTTGRGASFESGAVVSVTRSRFDANREVAIAVAAGAMATLEDLVVTGTLEAECAASSCADAPFGIALGSYSNATTVTVRRFRLEGSPLCGVQIADEGAVDLAEGQVRSNGIGACVQVEGYDVTRLQDRVLYEENGSNLDATTLPVPDALGAR